MHPVRPKLKLEVKLMENMLGVEEARRILGELISRVSRERETVVITRRAREKAVLMNYEEYRKLQELAAEATAKRAAEALARIRAGVAEAGIPESVVGEAVREVRSR